MRSTATIISLVSATFGLLALRRRFLLVTVRGSSMSPRYRDGDILLVLRRDELHYWNPGDAVVFPRPSDVLVPDGDPDYMVKRVVEGARGQSFANLFKADGPTEPRDNCLIAAGLRQAGGDIPTRYKVPVSSVVGGVIARVGCGSPSRGLELLPEGRSGVGRSGFRYSGSRRRDGLAARIRSWAAAMAINASRTANPAENARMGSQLGS